MFHYVNAITNTKGDALIGYYVRLRDSAGDTVPLYADENSTPIETESGVADAAKVDSNGNADFYVADGEYTIDIYATDGTTFVDSYPDIPMAKTGMLIADTVDALANLDTSYPAILTLSGSQGIFTFDASDLSTEVSADPERTTYVAPSSDDTGASGAWYRVTSAPVQQGAQQSGIVSGLGVAYLGNLDFVMSAGSYYLGGILHSAAEQEITLDAADPTDPRIDVLYLDTEGVLQKAAGTPAASPSKPSLDPVTQLELTFVLVPAGATDLSEVTDEDIYLENTEWTTSQTGTALTLASTNNPDTGSVCIEMTGSVSGSLLSPSVLLLRRASTMPYGGDGKLVLRIRAKATWGSQRRLLLFFVEGETLRGGSVTISDGAYGFDSSNTSTYQTVIIDKSAFGVTPTTAIDGLKIVIQGASNSTRGFYLDNIRLQDGADVISPGLDQAAADARYLRLIGGTLSGDLIVPDEAYGVGWNGSLEVPTKNAVYDKIEAVAAGNLSDGDKGDITVSASGATWTIDSNVISTFGRTLTDDADAATARATLSAASTSQTAEQISGFIAEPSDKDYKVVVKMAHAGTITETTTISASGTCTATFKINSTALGGTANSVSSAEQSQSHASNNAFSAGDDIVLTVSSNSSCADMSFTIKYTRTLS